MKIETIAAELTYPLRHEILRPGLPLAECFYSGDESPTSFHLGAYEGYELLGVASFHMKFHPHFTETVQFQLRGMATRAQSRTKGVGTALLKAGEAIVLTRSGKLLWFNARKSAFTFYERNGFAFFGEVFELPGIGPHKIMFKRFEKSHT